MAARWSTDEVLKLGPDDQVRRAAGDLANPRTWSELGSNDSLVWGKCQGSGKLPYQVTVDLTVPAFRCTCPSRKFPCKHGLALLLLWAGGGGYVADADSAAAFAAEWSVERESKAVAREQRSARRAETPPAPEEQAKREAARVSKMSAGFDEFSRWLADLVRQGLAAARRQPYAFWDTAATRLVDAQLPGLAERVREIAGDLQTRSDWADHLLDACGRWHLAAEAWRRRDTLDADVVANLRTFVGWSVVRGVGSEQPRVGDRWHVVGLRHAGDDRLQSQRTWLFGESLEAVSVVLDFAGRGPGAPGCARPRVNRRRRGRSVRGTAPRHVAFAGDPVIAGRITALPAATSIEVSLTIAAEWQAANPWLDRTPMTLASGCRRTRRTRNPRTGCRRLDSPDRGFGRSPAAPCREWWPSHRRVRRVGRPGVRTAHARRRRRAPHRMSVWDELVASALVGTARRPPPGAVLDVSLPDDADPSAAMLAGAAIAGSVPARRVRDAEGRNSPSARRATGHTLRAVGHRDAGSRSSPPARRQVARWAGAAARQRGWKAGTNRTRRVPHARSCPSLSWVRAIALSAARSPAPSAFGERGSPSTSRRGRGRYRAEPMPTS